MSVIEEAQFDNVSVTRNSERKLNGSQAAKLSSDGSKTTTGTWLYSS